MTGALTKFDSVIITIRCETEWFELTENGWNTLLQPHNVQQLTQTVKQMIGSQLKWLNPYGDGNCASKIFVSFSN